jgi:hypothetical protein
MRDACVGGLLAFADFIISAIQIFLCASILTLSIPVFEPKWVGTFFYR